METILTLTPTVKRFNLIYNDEMPFKIYIVLKFDASLLNAIHDNEINFTVDLIFKIPGKGKINKRNIITKENLTANSWLGNVYAGEFLREVTVLANKNVSENCEVKLSVNELKNDIENTKMDEEKLLHYILVDDWPAFIETIRKLSANDLKIFIANNLNHIQEINGPSAELIEYTLAKQIIEFWGIGVIELDQVDLAVEAYSNGYDFIKKNNQLIIQNYNKPDWQTLNSELHRRSELVNREYKKLKEKIKKNINVEEVLALHNAHQEVFNKNGDWLFQDCYEVLTKVTEIVYCLTLTKFEWEYIDGSDNKRQARINLSSSFGFKPFGFNLDFIFLLEINPITYKQEFTATILGYQSTQSELTSSEKNKQTKVMCSIKSLKDWEEIGYSSEIELMKKSECRLNEIEQKLYIYINDFISGSIIYRTFDFQTIKIE